MVLLLPPTKRWRTNNCFCHCFVFSSSCFSLSFSLFHSRTLHFFPGRCYSSRAFALQVFICFIKIILARRRTRAPFSVRIRQRRAAHTMHVDEGFTFMRARVHNLRLAFNTQFTEIHVSFLYRELCRIHSVCRRRRRMGPNVCHSPRQARNSCIKCEKTNKQARRTTHI